MSQLDAAFLQLRQHIGEIQARIDSLSIGTTSLATGKLSAELFPSKPYLAVLQGIKRSLPGTWYLVTPCDPENMWFLHKKTKLSTAVIRNSVTGEGERIFFFLVLHF